MCQQPLSNEVFLAINRIRHLWSQRADTNSVLKEIIKSKQYQSITKDVLQDHMDKLITDVKIINEIMRDKNSYEVNIELIDEKDQSFPVSPNDFPPASIITPINKKTPSIDFTLLNVNTPKNHKPINNDKDKQIRESHIDTIIKNDKGNTLQDSILNNLHKDIEDIINRKMESSFEKTQSIYKDELQLLRSELESKNSIIIKLLETIENTGKKAVQPNPLPIPKRHLEDNSNDTNESERKEIIVPEINNTNNNQKDSQQGMNNLNLGNTNSIEKQLNDVKMKKGKNIIGLKTTFKVMLLKKI